MTADKPYYARQKARQRERYAEDPKYREYHREYHKRWYQALHDDPELWKVFQRKMHQKYIKRKQLMTIR